MLHIIIDAIRPDEPLDRLLWSLSEDPPTNKFSVIVRDLTNNGDPKLSETLHRYKSCMRGQVVQGEGQYPENALRLPASAWPTPGSLAEAIQSGEPRQIPCLEGSPWASIMASLCSSQHPLILENARRLECMAWYGGERPEGSTTTKPVIIWPPYRVNFTDLLPLTKPSPLLYLGLDDNKQLTVCTQDIQLPVDCDQDAFRQHLIITDNQNYSILEEDKLLPYPLYDLVIQAWLAARDNNWKLFGETLDKCWSFELKSAGVDSIRDLHYASTRLSGAWGGRPYPNGLAIICSPNNAMEILRSI